MLEIRGPRGVSTIVAAHNVCSIYIDGQVNENDYA